METVKAYFLSMNRETVYLGIFLIIYCIALVIAHNIIAKKSIDTTTEKKWKTIKLVWRLACLIPLLVCGIHFATHYLKGLFSYTMRLYLPLYIGAILIAVCQFFVNKKVLLRIGKILTIIVTIVGFMTNLVIQNVLDWETVVGNATQVNYVDSFEILMSEMKSHYALNEWKSIDYDKIREELMPEFEKAQANQSKLEYYIALQKYVNYFHDEHIWLDPKTEEGFEIQNEANEKLVGNDYGFSLFTVNSGETVAILVDEECEAKKNGIANGTAITKWNGEPIEKAMKNAEYILGDSEPVLENFELKRPIYFAGKGGDSVEVSFIDKDKKEKTITVNSIGSYIDRFNKAMNYLLKRYDMPPTKKILEMSEEEIAQLVADIEASSENFRSDMITEDCGYLVINSEQIDTYKDSYAEITQSYPEVTELVDKKLEQLKSQGMKKLIIDTRGNGGGHETISSAVASLFTKEEIKTGSSAYVPYTGGDAQNYVYRFVPANGKWADLPVVVLTNSDCASSGDILVYMLSKCPNVTTMGISQTRGIAQSIGAVCYMTDGDFSISYPMFMSLDEKGEILIDTKADRNCRVPIDEKIPITKEAVLEIFSDKNDEVIDYELRYAINSFK